MIFRYCERDWYCKCLGMYDIKKENSMESAAQFSFTRCFISQNSLTHSLARLLYDTEEPHYLELSRSCCSTPPYPLQCIFLNYSSEKSCIWQYILYLQIPMPKHESHNCELKMSISCQFALSEQYFSCHNMYSVAFTDAIRALNSTIFKIKSMEFGSSLVKHVFGLGRTRTRPPTSTPK